MSEETYDQQIRRMRAELRSLGTRNIVVYLKDGTDFKAQLVGDVETSLDFGALYYMARNKEGKLYLSTKIGIQKIERFERDPTDYPVFYIGGGHPE